MLKRYNVAIVDSDMEIHEYICLGLNLWVVIEEIRQSMLNDGDYFGHKIENTIQLVVNELVA